MLFKKCKSLLTDNYGLGVILSYNNDRKEECPMAFASRTKTEAEKRYSQLEKEALSITYGVEKSRQYLLGRKCVLVTDNRPLIPIFSPQKPIFICAASIIKRWSLKLAAFNYTEELRKSSDNSNVDALSPLPLESSVRESLDVDQRNYLTAYTDESSDLTLSNGGAGINIILQNRKHIKIKEGEGKISPNFTCELTAIWKTLDLCLNQPSLHQAEGILIYSDSISALEAIQKGNTIITQKIHSLLTLLESLDNNCILQWIPARVGIAEEAAVVKKEWKEEKSGMKGLPDDRRVPRVFADGRKRTNYL
ncbi:hypothetical protein LAZ67_4001329, partial [Cordylochernes scorpioides]